MLDEERLQYTGSMVLGLNDALVELTGALAGLTFAFQNLRLVALAGRLDPDDRANARNSGALRDPTDPPRAAATLPPAAASR